MKWVEEFRDAAAVDAIARAIRAETTRPWSIMEVCGGQTHAIVRFGIDQLLPRELTLVHGPGCPVCVTPLEQIDRALAIAARPGVVFCSFGDMLRVPGSRGDLLAVNDVSFAVGRRLREIGIRMALGAHRRDVIRMILGQGAAITLLGGVLGVAGALLLSRWLGSLVYGVSVRDAFSFSLAAVVLVLVGLAASYLPARRAARLDPIAVLRRE